MIKVGFDQSPLVFLAGRQYAQASGQARRQARDMGVSAHTNLERSKTESFDYERLPKGTHDDCSRDGIHVGVLTHNRERFATDARSAQYHSGNDQRISSNYGLNRSDSFRQAVKPDEMSDVHLTEESEYTKAMSQQCALPTMLADTQKEVIVDWLNNWAQEENYIIEPNRLQAFVDNREASKKRAASHPVVKPLVDHLVSRKLSGELYRAIGVSAQDKQEVAGSMVSAKCASALPITSLEKGVGEAVSGVLEAADPSGLAALGANTLLSAGKDYVMQKTAGASEHLAFKGIFVPDKSYWHVPERKYVVNQMQQTIALFDTMEKANVHVPPELNVFLDECRTLYKNVNTKACCFAGAHLVQQFTSVLKKATYYSLTAVGTSIPILFPLAIVMAKLADLALSVLGEAAGEIVKMDQIWLQNGQHVDLVNVHTGQIDTHKASQLYLRPHQIQEKYLSAVMSRHMARALHYLDEAEMGMQFASEASLQKNDEICDAYRQMMRCTQDIERTQALIADHKVRVDKGQRRDVQILIALKQSVRPEDLKQMVLLCKESVCAEHKKWAKEHKTHPTSYTSDVHALFKLISYKTKERFIYEAHKQAKHQEFKAEAMLGQFGSGKTLLIHLEDKLKKLTDKQGTLAEKINVSAMELSTNRGIEKNSLQRIRRHGQASEKNLIQCKAHLNEVIADYNTLQILLQMGRDGAHPRDVDQQMSQLHQDGLLVRMLMDKKVLAQEAQKCLKVQPELLFGGFSVDQLHPQVQANEQHDYQVVCDRLKKMASPDTGYFPAESEIGAFITYYKLKGLDPTASRSIGDQVREGVAGAIGGIGSGITKVVGNLSTMPLGMVMSAELKKKHHEARQLRSA